MRVVPISQKEAEEASQGFQPLPPGEYDFTVFDATEEISSKGNEMLKLVLLVHTMDGKSRKVFDYLVSSPGMAYKIRHFAEAVGMVRQYEQGDLNIHDMAEKEGRCKIARKPAQGAYAAGNQVSDYIPRAEQERAAPQRTQAIDRAPKPSRERVPAGDIDDEIPF